MSELHHLYGVIITEDGLDFHACLPEISDRIADNLALVVQAKPDSFHGVLKKWRNARTRG
jgi:hypothetical protein